MALIGFTIQLFVVVDLSFIGQMASIALMAFLALDLHRLSHGGTADPVWMSSISFDSHTVLFAAVIIMVILSVTNPLKEGFLARLCRGIDRYTVGIGPIKVFTDAQLYGFYLYRILAEFRDGQTRELVQAFKSDGSQGPLQRWHPRIFLKSTLDVVTDFCFLVQERDWDEVRKAIQFEGVSDLIACGFLEINPADREKTKRIIMCVKAVEANKEPSAGGERFTVSDWAPVAGRLVIKGQLSPLTLVAPPRRVSNTARALSKGIRWG
jgi:hypothetical protein